MDDLDPDELDDFIAAWDEVDREAVELLRTALGGHRGLLPPAVELATAVARIREEIDADLFRDERLTPLGAWTLPRALALAWGGEFDPPTTG